MRTSRRNDSCRHFHQTGCSAFQQVTFQYSESQCEIRTHHTGSVEDLRRLPKRRVTTSLQDIQIVNDHLQDRFTVASTTARNAVKCNLSNGSADMSTCFLSVNRQISVYNLKKTTSEINISHNIIFHQVANQKSFKCIVPLYWSIFNQYCVCSLCFMYICH